MKLYEIYFSPTGGTRKISNIIGESWDIPKIEIDLTLSQKDFSKYSFEKEDICIISVPSFGGRVPEIALTRIKKMTGGSANALIIVVYGNRAYEDTLLELKEAVTFVGFRCVGAITAIAEHSIMHQFAQNRPDEKDKEELIKFGENVKLQLELKNNNSLIEVPGNAPYKEYKGVSLKPEMDKGCISCGLCADKCPVNAIEKNNPFAIEKTKCISCMRCVSICPNHVRKLNEKELLASYQKFKDVCSERKENKLYI